MPTTPAYCPNPDHDGAHVPVTRMIVALVPIAQLVDSL